MLHPLLSRVNPEYLAAELLYSGLTRLSQDMHLKAHIEAEDRQGIAVMPPFQVARDSAIVKAINDAYAELRGEPQPTGAITPTRFYGSDAGHLYELGGMEGIVCGCGGRYNTMPDERVDIVDYIDMIKVYMLTILNICGVADE